MRQTLMALTAMLALTLTACGDSDESDVDTVTVTVQDGRQVACVLFKRGYAGGIDCDFPDPKPTPLVMQSPTVDPRP